MMAVMQFGLFSFTTRYRIYVKLKVKQATHANIHTTVAWSSLINNNYCEDTYKVILLH